MRDFEMSVGVGKSLAILESNKLKKKVTVCARWRNVILSYSEEIESISGK